jgi:hypothetical protein
MTIIDREQAIQAQQDAVGNNWKVVPHPSTNLYHLVVVKDDELTKPQSMPSAISGLFTNVTRATEALKPYLKSSWDKADAAAEKVERKATAEKEAPAKTKKEDKAA